MTYPDNILEIIRQHWGLPYNDTSLDDKINSRPKRQILNEICTYYLGPGWGSQILIWLKDCGFKTE